MSAKILELRLMRFWVSKVVTTKTKTVKKPREKLLFDTRLKIGNRGQKFERRRNFEPAAKIY